MAVYKYVSPERIDVLQNCRVRYTQPRYLNDPFELRPHFSDLMGREELRAC